MSGVPQRGDWFVQQCVPNPRNLLEITIIEYYFDNSIASPFDENGFAGTNLVARFNFHSHSGRLGQDCVHLRADPDHTEHLAFADLTAHGEVAVDTIHVS